MAYKDTRSNRKRRNRISFYLSDEELELVNEKMKATNLTNRSDFIRENLLNNFILVNDYDYLRQLIVEINKIGTNINQIARIANTNNYINKNEIKELKIMLDKIWELINKKM